MTGRLIDPTTDPSMWPRPRFIVTIQRVEVLIQRVKEWNRIRDEGSQTYDYVNTDAVTETTEKVYEQVVRSLDVVEVIAAVNGSGCRPRNDYIEEAMKHPDDWKPGARIEVVKP